MICNKLIKITIFANNNNYINSISEIYLIMKRNNKPITCVLALVVTMPMVAKELPKKLNIIYIMTDDHSYQTLSAYDNRFIETPNIDRIAKEGMLFQRSYVTNSISGPSRAVLLTGKFSHLNGFTTNSDHFDGSQQTFPKLLQAAGYQTAMIGKWHLDSEPTGFDYWNILPGQGVYYNPEFIEMGNKKRYDGYVTQLTTDIALEWLSNQRELNRPFCMLLHHKAPHRTWMPDIRHLGSFDHVDFPIPDNFYDQYEGREGAAHQRMSIDKDMNLIYDLKMVDMESDFASVDQPGLDRAGRAFVNALSTEQRFEWDKYYNPIIDDLKERNLSGKALAEWKYQRYMKDYLSCIKSVDENIGRLLNYLEENNLSHNTVIIYTSDQGFYMGEHGWFDKRFMYEESFRTPLLIKLPEGIGVKGHSNVFAQNIDNAPTILNIAGLEIPKDMQGKSLLPVLQGKSSPNFRRELYYHFYENFDDHGVSKHFGIRNERYKLICFYDPLDTWELYDLKRDPSEMKNVYHHKSYSGVVRQLKKRLTRLQMQYKDPILTHKSQNY